MTERIYPSSKPLANPPGQTLNGNGNTNNNQPFPPTKSQLYGATRPTYRPQPKRRRRRSCCCSCFLWSTLLIIIILILAAIVGAVIYSIYQPKRPTFSLYNLHITQFNITTFKDGTSNLNSKLDLIISAKNPNKDLIFYYNPINTSVFSNGVDIGDGSFPSLIHGTKNVTLLKFKLISPSNQVADLDPATADLLKTDMKKKSGLPLNIQLNTEVKVKIGGLKTKKVGIQINCDQIRAVPKKGKGGKSNSTSWEFSGSSPTPKCKVNLQIKIWKWTF